MLPAMTNNSDEPRFGFGRNWRAFLSILSEERVLMAETSLKEMLGVPTLDGRTFVDVGSGSGLFSLAAMRLGAVRVHSFDYDLDSVSCTAELRRRFFPDSTTWTVEQGSALDPDYILRLGTFDVVYSWGVLHHTGRMYDALESVVRLTDRSGQLFIAIYNDQGWQSRGWTVIKRLYNTNRLARVLIVSAFVPYYVLGGLAADLVRRRHPLRRYRAHTRGMSHVYDWIDWLGGYPFEVATREAITDFYCTRGFSLAKLHGCGRKSGCNEFVFVKE
jgi:2-polyprenyl-6-hydroxyphenyl methylase/3-demethylubiquinone-9 3-methyltransferase